MDHNHGRETIKHQRKEAGVTERPLLRLSNSGGPQAVARKKKPWKLGSLK